MMSCRGLWPRSGLLNDTSLVLDLGLEALVLVEARIVMVRCRVGTGSFFFMNTLFL